MVVVIIRRRLPYSQANRSAEVNGQVISLGAMAVLVAVLCDDYPKVGSLNNGKKKICGKKNCVLR